MVLMNDTYYLVSIGIATFRKRVFGRIWWKTSMQLPANHSLKIMKSPPHIHTHSHNPLYNSVGNNLHVKSVIFCQTTRTVGGKRKTIRTDWRIVTRLVCICLGCVCVVELAACICSLPFGCLTSCATNSNHLSHDRRFHQTKTVKWMGKSGQYYCPLFTGDICSIRGDFDFDIVLLSGEHQALNCLLCKLPSKLRGCAAFA